MIRSFLMSAFLMTASTAAYAQSQPQASPALTSAAEIEVTGYDCRIAGLLDLAAGEQKDLDEVIQRQSDAYYYRDKTIADELKRLSKYAKYSPNDYGVESEISDGDEVAGKLIDAMNDHNDLVKIIGKKAAKWSTAVEVAALEKFYFALAVAEEAVEIGDFVSTEKALSKYGKEIVENHQRFLLIRKHVNRLKIEIEDIGKQRQDAIDNYEAEGVQFTRGWYGDKAHCDAPMPSSMDGRWGEPDTRGAFFEISGHTFKFLAGAGVFGFDACQMSYSELKYGQNNRATVDAHIGCANSYDMWIKPDIDVSMQLKSPDVLNLMVCTSPKYQGKDSCRVDDYTRKQ